jgi:hypothetical protein
VRQSDQLLSDSPADLLGPDNCVLPQTARESGSALADFPGDCRRRQKENPVPVAAGDRAELASFDIHSQAKGSDMAMGFAQAASQITFPAPERVSSGAAVIAGSLALGKPIKHDKRRNRVESMFG